MSKALITGDAGRICFLPKGEYSSTETYAFLDFVYYEGAAYVAKKETTGNPPDENNEFWQILAGVKASSVTGVKGDKEKDYRIGNVNITAANVGALSLTDGSRTISRESDYVIVLDSKNRPFVGISFHNKDVTRALFYINELGEVFIRGKDNSGDESTYISVTTNDVDLGAKKNNQFCIKGNDAGVYHYGKKLYEEGDSPKFANVTVNKNLNMGADAKILCEGEVWAAKLIESRGAANFRGNVYIYNGDGLNFQVWQNSWFYNAIHFNNVVEFRTDSSPVFYTVPDIRGTFTGTFKTSDNKTVAVTNGIITSVQ